MDSCRQRQEVAATGTGSLRRKPEPRAATMVPKPAAVPVVGPSKPRNPAPEQPRNPAAEQPRSPAAEQPRKSKNRIQKLEREVVELETRIGELESAQRRRSELLADPAVYADKQQSTQLLAEFRDNQPELERLTARWEQAQGELETLVNGSASP
jgi:ATP-binding cassette subfamily F protein 3